MGSQVKKGSSAKQVSDKSRSEVKDRKSILKKSIIKVERKQIIPKKEKINYIDRTKTYLKAVYNELKKVHWLSRREVLIYTGVVLVAVMIVGVLIWVFDSLLSQLLQFILK